MCIGSSPDLPDPPPPPQVQAVAEVQEGTGLKGASQRRAELLIKKRTGSTGAAAPSTGSTPV